MLKKVQKEAEELLEKQNNATSAAEKKKYQRQIAKLLHPDNAKGWPAEYKQAWDDMFKKYYSD